MKIKVSDELLTDVITCLHNGGFGIRLLAQNESQIYSIQDTPLKIDTTIQKGI